MLCRLYALDAELAREQIARIFRKKDDAVIAQQPWRCSTPASAWAEANLDLQVPHPGAARRPSRRSCVNGNTAIALGVMASGMDICAMYPITPATSASHYLSEVFEKVGGLVHQAEDEIAACAFAIGAVVRRQVRGDDHLRARATRSSRRCSGWR